MTCIVHITWVTPSPFPGAESEDEVLEKSLENKIAFFLTIH